MNDSELARREARAERQHADTAALAELGISSAEATLFQIIHLGLTVAPDDLCRRAAAVPEYAIGEQLSSAEYTEAMHNCLSKGWLRIVDEAALARLQDEVRQAGLLGPVYGFPHLGGVDFTRDGAEHWLRFRKHRGWSENSDSHPYSDVVHVKQANYFPTHQAALRGIERIEQSEFGVVSISQPHSIGPWRAKWWQRFSEGYRVDVEQRMQWRGRSPEGYISSVHFDSTAVPIDVGHAKNVLARRRLPLVAWLVMASVDGYLSEREISHFATRRAKQLGECLSPKECLAAVRAWIEVGCLRARNDNSIAEIESLLRADGDAFMPVPLDQTQPFTGVDFTVAGAEFYRKLSAEILGDGWEDANNVEEVIFMEAHHYCATEAAITAAIGGYSERGMTPLSSRTVPIGPWCVYWWERFPSGCRLELSFGKST